jgi:hypothetical protein
MTASAATLTTTFGPGDTLQAAGNPVLSNGSYANVANQFSLSGTAYVTGIDLGVTASSTSQLSVSIYSDANGAPGDDLYSTIATVGPNGTLVSTGQFGSIAQISTISTGPLGVSVQGNLLLQQGTNYWLVLGAPFQGSNPQGQGAVWWSSIARRQNVAIQSSADGVNFIPCQFCSGGNISGNWDLFSGGNQGYAFSLEGNVAPVPLPAAAWLLLSALGGLRAMARRQRRVAA